MKVICFGDSNTYGFDPRSYFGGRYEAANRWVDRLAASTGWQMINMGQNGLAISDAEYEADLYDSLLCRPDTDLLIIMLGSNDLLQGLSAKSAAARMSRFISSLSIERGKILLLSPPAFKPGMWVENGKTLEQSSLLGGMYMELSQKLGVNFADSGKWNVDLCYDGVHFSEAGHRAFADNLFKTLTKDKEI